MKLKKKKKLRERGDIDPHKENKQKGQTFFFYLCLFVHLLFIVFAQY